jgi:hypothetical protein
LPSEQGEDKPKAVSGVGDGGLAWLKKSFERAKQQAKDAGRPLEEIVAERWGVSEIYTENLCIRSYSIFDDCL